jgi:hypothetical protein
MSKRTDAKPGRKRRKSSTIQKERIQDTMLLVQSARETLTGVDNELVPEKPAIEECFDSADKALKSALRP